MTTAQHPHLTLAQDFTPGPDAEWVLLHPGRARTGADGVKSDYCYVRIGGVSVSFHLDPDRPGEARKISVHRVPGGRMIPHGYVNGATGDALDITFVDMDGEHDTPAVRRFLAEVTAKALRSIGSARAWRGRPNR